MLETTSFIHVFNSLSAYSGVFSIFESQDCTRKILDTLLDLERGRNTAGCCCCCSSKILSRQPNNLRMLWTEDHRRRMHNQNCIRFHWRLQIDRSRVPCPNILVSLLRCRTKAVRLLDCHQYKSSRNYIPIHLKLRIDKSHVPFPNSLVSLFQCRTKSRQMFLLDICSHKAVGNIGNLQSVFQDKKLHSKHDGKSSRRLDDLTHNLGHHRRKRGKLESFFQWSLDWGIYIHIHMELIKIKIS